MKRKNRLNSLRRGVSDSEEWRIELLASSGFSYKFIAQRVFGDSREFTRVG